MIKVFVSTMYSGEGDFHECINSIKKQRLVQVEHHVIYGQRELEAHQNQIKAWHDVQNRFDLFVKVDADTVITSEHAFIKVWETLLKYDGSAAQIKLHDYFTNTLINGLNFYTKDSIFSIPTDKVFCDRSVKHKKLLHSDNGYFNDLVPIGQHCFYSTEKQAFHYGVHRGVKDRFLENESIKRAYSQKNDRLRLLAIKGFEKSHIFKQNNEFNYSDELFKNVFKETLDEIERG